MNVQSLDLYIERKDGYEVHLEGPERRAKTKSIKVSLPDDDEYRGALKAFLDGKANAEEAKYLGERLFEGFFKGEVRDLFAKCYPDSGEKGVRLYIHLEPECGELFSLPWELLWYRDDFVGVNPLCSIVRFIDLGYSSTPLLVSPPLRLRLALCSASPKCYSAINAEREIDGIKRELAQNSVIDVQRYDHLTTKKLQRLLRDGVHIVHFAGHSELEEGRGFLVLEQDDSCAPDRVSGDRLGQLFTGRQVRLVVINACYGAREGRGGHVGVFEGVAPALIKAGVPAVVAMQIPIPDQAAIEFAVEFYCAMFERNLTSVDIAVIEGRKAIIRGDDKWREHPYWAAPVIYLRDRGGILFDINSRSNELIRSYPMFKNEDYMRRLMAELNLEPDSGIPFRSLPDPKFESLVYEMERRDKLDLLERIIKIVLESGSSSVPPSPPLPSSEVLESGPSPVPPSPPLPSSELERRLEDFIEEHFKSRDGMIRLLRHLDVEYDDLEGDTRPTKIVSLVRRYVRELEQPQLLLAAIEQERKGLLSKHGLA